MDKYLDYFREMISLRGLTDHTLSNYCTYIKAYLHYLTDILHKSPEDVSWSELRDYIRWLQKSGTLSDRTIDTIYVHLSTGALRKAISPFDSLAGEYHE